MTDAIASDRVGPAVHRFLDTGTAYDFTQSEESALHGLRDGDVLVISREGVVGLLANDWPLALTEARGRFQRAAPNCSVREMDGGRYSASVDVAERAAAGLGLSLLPHLAPPGVEPADELDERQAQQLVAGAWGNAERFQERRDRNGRLLGYTFQVGSPDVARYGWIAAGGTYAKELERRRSRAAALLPAADECAARR